MYVGAEFTASGCRAATRLAALEPSLRFTSLPFDYRNPGFPVLDGLRHAVVFTAHSIEQIPYVSVDLFAAIRGIAKRTTCLHFEPVGWQVRESDGNTGSGQPGSSRAYASGNDYNLNLIEMLRRAENEGILDVDHVSTEVIGVNPSNATSVIRWSSLTGRA